jgi:hypothetical protein
MTPFLEKRNSDKAERFAANIALAVWRGEE